MPLIKFPSPPCPPASRAGRTISRFHDFSAAELCTLGPCGSSQPTAKLRHVAERVVGGTESLGRRAGVAYRPSSAVRFLPSAPCCLPLASASCSLQRFNAIPCKFVCGQVYMVPGLSVSSIYPRSFSSLRPAIRLPRPPPAIRRFNPPPSSPLSALHYSGST